MKSVRSKKRDSEQLETIGEAVTTTTTIIAEAPEMMTVSASESSVVKEECSKESEKNEEEHDVQVISGDEDATPPLSVDISLQNKLIHEDDDTWDFEVTSFVKTAGVGSAKKDRRPDAEMDISVEDNVDVSNCQLNKESPKLTVSSGVPNNDHNDTTALSTENVKTRPEYKPVRKSRSNLLRLTKDRKRGLGVSYQETNTPHLSEEPAAKRQKMETDTDDNKDECNVPKVVENKEPRLVEQSSQDCSIVEPTVDQSPHKADSTHTDQKLGKELQEETPKVKLISAGKITPKKQLTTGLGVRKQLKLSTNAPQSQQKSNNSPQSFPQSKVKLLFRMLLHHYLLQRRNLFTIQDIWSLISAMIPHQILFRSLTATLHVWLELNVKFCGDLSRGNLLQLPRNLPALLLLTEVAEFYVRMWSPLCLFLNSRHEGRPNQVI